MIHDGAVLGLPLVSYVATKATIEALTEFAEGMVAYASDTNELGSYNGTSWDWLTISKVGYVFEDTTERDTFFAAYPALLVVDALIVIKDDSPPPTPGVRSLDFSKAINSQYLAL